MLVGKTESMRFSAIGRKVETISIKTSREESRLPSPFETSAQHLSRSASQGSLLITSGLLHEVRHWRSVHLQGKLQNSCMRSPSCCLTHRPVSRHVTARATNHRRSDLDLPSVRQRRLRLPIGRLAG